MNEKIAEWVGFKRVWTHCDCTMCQNTMTTPDGEGRVFEPPHFEHDFNAILKWVEPVLFEKGLRYNTFRLQDGHRVDIVKKSIKGWTCILSTGFADTLSEAFCKAVEKLIEQT